MADEVEEAVKTAGQGIKEAAHPVLESLLPTAFQGAVESLQARASDNRQNRMYKENQRMLFDLSQESQRNAASNQVEGLRRAGLSTAQASGAQGMGISAASAPHGSPHAGAANPEMALIKSQAELLQSETRLNDVKREGEEIDNANKEGANLTYASAYDSILDVMEADAKVVGDKVTLSVVGALRENKNIVRTAGDLQALQQVAKMVQASPAIMAQRIHDYLTSSIENVQANTPSIVAAQVIAPLLRNDETRERIALMSANAAKFYSDAEANKELLPKLREEVKWLGSQIKHLDIQTQEIHNSDVASALVNGDYDIVAANALIGVAHAGKEVAVYSVPTARAGKVLDSVGKKIESAVGGSRKAAAPPAHPLKAQPKKPPRASSDAATMKKWYGTRGEAPQMSVMNGKPYYQDAAGNWHKVTKPKH